MPMDANKSWSRTYDESVASLGGLSFVKLGDRDMNFWTKEDHPQEGRGEKVEKKKSASDALQGIVTRTHKLGILGIPCPGSRGTHCEYHIIYNWRP